ncbi:MAG: UDP-2,4-diacetamido-2,4,6-trideoxy-beta-L-altropyranose hydrolase [Armatimonadota bacterium]
MHSLVRADASFDIGTGHVMRCLALAQQALDLGSPVTWAAAELPAPLRERIEAEGIAVERVAARPGSPDDAAATLELIRRSEPRWLVLDGYQFGREYCRTLRRGGASVLALDDGDHAERLSAGEPIEADLVLNQNVGAAPELYTGRVEPERVLVGPRYALLRREFRQHPSGAGAVARVATRVLVTMGGSDPRGLTAAVIRALKLLGGSLEARVLAGAANPHFEALQELARGDERIRLMRSAADMPAEMAWAEVAVAAAGSTCWELAYMGLPSVVIPAADNQRSIVRGLAALGAAVCLEPEGMLEPGMIRDALQQLLEDAEQRRLLRDRMRSLVDGQGAVRVLTRMAALGAGA